MKMKVLITGTSQGIGRAICQLFLDKEHEVIGFDRNEVNMISDNYTHYQIDIRDYDKLPEHHHHHPGNQGYVLYW